MAKNKKSGHLHFGESSLTRYTDECGQVSVSRTTYPAGLDADDVPFIIKGGRVKSDSKLSSLMTDWRPADAKAKQALERAEAELLQAGKRADEVMKNFRPEHLPFSEHVDMYHFHVLRVETDAELETVRKNFKSKKEVARLRFTEKRQAELLGKRNGKAPDAWALVSGDAVSRWLAGPHDHNEDLSAMVLSPFNPDFKLRLSPADRERLRTEREKIACRKNAVLENIRADLGLDRISQIPLIYHNISVSSPCAVGVRTETADAMITEACLGWGARSLDVPIRKTGNPYMIELQNQQHTIRAREKAREYIGDSLVGGQVLGRVPGVEGAELGSGGMRYKIDISATRATDNTVIYYRNKKRKNSFGTFSKINGLFVKEKGANRESELAALRYVSDTFTELDAIVNSCLCPSIAPGARDEKKRLEFCGQAVLDRDCVELDDIYRPYYLKFTSRGAKSEMMSERSENTKARRNGFTLVSAEELAEEVSEVSGGGLDLSGVLRDSLISIARLAATKNREDDFDKYLSLRLGGKTQEEAGNAVNISRKSAGDWEKRIISTAHELGADATLGDIAE